MYNTVTAENIMRASPLEDLDIERLPQKLTEAYARIVSARISVLEGNNETSLKEILDEISRLGHTYLGLVNFAQTSEVMKSAAFVAGSAFELLAIFRGAAQDGNFSATTICPTCTAALLFMIADATSDASEVTKYLPEEKNFDNLEEQLKHNIRCLALGEVVKIADSPNFEAHKDSEDILNKAIFLLYTRCLSGIKELSKALLGSGDIDTAISIFSDTKEKCIDNCSDLIEEYIPEGPPIFSTFPGPFLLASLLEIVSRRLYEHSLLGISTPDITNVELWQNEIERFAQRRPYLWPNHKLVIEDQRCLDHNVSMVLGLPTGAGKTTLAQLKATANLVDNYKILFLAPTHALVRQITQEWREIFPDKDVRNTFLFDGEYAETESEVLPDITIMTPERCLALLTIAPEAFHEVGLVILDECHILHAASFEDSYRATDAMFCLLRLFDEATSSDFLLMSAMIENADDLAAWVEQQTERRCASVLNAWKPTRQVRSCVIYPHREIHALQQNLNQDKSEARRTGRKSPGVQVKRELEIDPYGFFSLNQTWTTTKLRDYIVLPLSDDKVLLGANNYWGLTSNRNVVSAGLAAKLSDANLKTIVFTQQVNYTLLIARKVSELVQLSHDLMLNEYEQGLRQDLIQELGGSDHIYEPVGGIAGCHHGLLLAKEREFIESLFARDNGIKVLVATPTIAQGMNLPAEAVIIAGDERFDAAQNEQEQLEAHELLNAAGRAGRAGKHAQGFVLVVPGRVVSFNDEDNTLTERWFSLQERVFSKSDQCLTVIDPLQRLIDAVQSGTLEDNRPAHYMLRRVPYNPDESSEESVRRTMMRSFAAFMARQRQDTETFERGVAGAVELSHEIAPSPDLEEHPLVVSLAVEFGISPDFIQEISSFLADIELDLGVSDYLLWSFEDHVIEKMIKPQAMENIVKALTTTAERRERRDANRLALSRLEPLLQRWIEGLPLRDLELQAGTQRNRLGKCIKARKLALRWSADAAFALGVVTRLYRRRLDFEERSEMPISLATLASCVRQGVDLPEKLAILHLTNFEITRVQSHYIFENIHDFLEEGEITETFTQTRKRVRKAMIQKGYL